MRKRKKNFINGNYDEHIIEELKKLPQPLKTFDNHNVSFSENKRKETIFEHIANKKHHLHNVDILVIPKILKTKVSVVNDRNGHKYRTYVGERGKKKERNKYLKIVTNVKKNGNEVVVTICTIKNKCLKIK